MSETQAIHDLKSTPLRRRLLLGACSGALLALLGLGLRRVPALRPFENRALDLLQQQCATRTQSVDQVVLVLIDDYSIKNALDEDGNTYPWPRDYYVAITGFLRAAGARAIVYDMIFSEPGKNRGTDEPFAEAIKEAGNVVLAAKLSVVPSDAKPPDPASFEPVLARSAYPVPGWSHTGRESVNTLTPPIPPFTAAAAGIGFVNVLQDLDNTIRHVDLVYPYPGGAAGRCMVSLAASAYLTAFPGAKAGAPPELSVAPDGRSLRLGARAVPLTAGGSALLRFYGKEGTFVSKTAISLVRSFVAQQEGAGARLSVDPAVFKDKIVIIGVNAAGLEDVVPVPVSTRFPGPELHATVIANLLGNEWLRPLTGLESLAWYLAIGILGGLLTWGLWKPVPATLGAIALLVPMAAVGWLGYRQGVAFELFFPGALVMSTALVTAVAGYLLEGRQKKEVSRAFMQYLSPVVIRQVMSNPDALRLGGETREIAVYFSDIAGFSSFSESMSASDLVSFLNRYLSVMTDIILERQGVVDKYVGDLIMAFWGAPLAIERPGLQACLAVLEQRRAMAHLQAKFREEGLPPFDFRTGLNFGPAKVGNMGSNRRFNYTAMGDTVNLASRLEGANKHFGTHVLMTEAVRASAGDGVVSRKIGKVQVVGKTVATLVHELLCTREEGTPETLERLKRYHDALALLEAGDNAGAASAFEALQAREGDTVIEICLEKARELLASGERWDGVWILESKG